MDNHFLLECTLPSSDTFEDGDNSGLANIKCTSCPDFLTASSWCVDCNDFLCDGCVQVRLSMTTLSVLTHQ